MIPSFFGPQDKIKYGVFHPAVGSGAKGRGIVICDALFDEAIRAHRALRYASESMAAARWNSFRFDYYGTGDSAGDTEDFGLTQACQDINQAVEELKAMAALSGVFILGLRLGGALAMCCATERPDIRGAILWDPVIDGQSVIDEYEQLAKPETNGRHLGGFKFKDALLDDLRTFSSRACFEQFSKPILMVCTAPGEVHYELAERYANIELRVLDAPEAWLRHPTGGVKPIPAAVIRQIEAWQG
jgi:pimeloyl-ACP methyl ester carboxylesterase